MKPLFFYLTLFLIGLSFNGQAQFIQGQTYICQQTIDSIIMDGMPISVDIEPGTGNRDFKIELIGVSGGHTVHAGKSPIRLTIFE